MHNKFYNLIIALSLCSSVVAAEPKQTATQARARAAQKAEELDTQFLTFHWLRLVNAPKRQATWTVTFPAGKTITGDLIVDLSDRIESHDGDHRHIALIDSTSAARCFITLPEAHDVNVPDVVGEVKCKGLPIMRYASTGSPLGAAAIGVQQLSIPLFDQQKNLHGTLSIAASTARTSRHSEVALSEIFVKIYDRSLFELSSFQSWNDQNSARDVRMVNLPPTATHRVKAMVTQTIVVDKEALPGNNNFRSVRRWNRQNWRFETSWTLDDNGFTRGQPKLLETFTTLCSILNPMGCSAPQIQCARTEN